MSPEGPREGEKNKTWVKCWPLLPWYKAPCQVPPSPFLPKEGRGPVPVTGRPNPVSWESLWRSWATFLHQHSCSGPCFFPLLTRKQMVAPAWDLNLWMEMRTDVSNQDGIEDIFPSPVSSPDSISKMGERVLKKAVLILGQPGFCTWWWGGPRIENMERTKEANRHQRLSKCKILLSKILTALFLKVINLWSRVPTAFWEDP